MSTRPLPIPTPVSCGGTIAKPVPYQTPSYLVPTTIPSNAIVVAANGGSDYIYVKDHNKTAAQKIVTFLQSHEQYGAVFVAKKYAGIPGTVTMDNIKIESTAGRNPDIMVSFTWNDKQLINGMPGIEYESFGPNRGMHGSFGPTDVHNTLVAMGSDFQPGFIDILPTGTVDVAPILAQLLGVSLPGAEAVHCMKRWSIRLFSRVLTRYKSRQSIPARHRYRYRYRIFICQRHRTTPMWILR